MTVFLPCRAGSERVPFKNTRDFAGIPGGLIMYKLSRLLEISEIDQIVVSTNDQKVQEIADGIGNTKIKIDVRPDHLATSETSTDDLIKYVPTIITDEDIIWTHVTSPFLTAESIIKGIRLYQDHNKYDSVMSVNKIQAFLWNEGGAVNYDREIEKWPRTQTINPLFEINSGFFINSRSNYLRLRDRIGINPYLFITEGFESLDIDWPEDFQLAEMVYHQRFKKL